MSSIVAPRLTWISSATAAEVCIANGVISALPALLTRMSIGPPATAAARSTTPSTSIGRDKSTQSGKPPISPASSSSAANVRAASTTRAPRAANVRATAAPIPYDAPVTRTRCPRTSTISPLAVQAYSPVEESKCQPVVRRPRTCHRRGRRPSQCVRQAPSRERAWRDLTVRRAARPPTSLRALCDGRNYMPIWRGTVARRGDVRSRPSVLPRSRVAPVAA